MSKGKITKQIVITIRETKPNTTNFELDVNVWPDKSIAAIEVIEVLAHVMNMVLEHRSKPNKP